MILFVARRVCGGEPTRTRAFWQRQTRAACGELSVGWGLPTAAQSSPCPARCAEAHPMAGFARRVCGGEPTRTRAFWQWHTCAACGELSVGWGLPHRRTIVAMPRTVRRGAPYGRLFAIEKSPSPAGWSPQQGRFGGGRRSAGARSPAFAASVVFIAVSGSPCGWRGLPRRAPLRGWLRPVSGGRAYCARCLRSPRSIPSQSPVRG